MFPNLKDLRIDMNKIDDTKQMAYDCQLTELQKLSARDNKFKEQGCFYIQIYAFRNLTHLNLSKNCIKDEGVEQLSKASYLRNLVSLHLDDNMLTLLSGLQLGQSPFLTKLDLLSMGYNSLKDEGLIELSKSANFKELTHLYIQNNYLTQRSIGELVFSVSSPDGNFTKLIHLDLKQNTIGDYGLALLSQTGFKALHYLDVSHNEITE